LIWVRVEHAHVVRSKSDQLVPAIEADVDQVGAPSDDAASVMQPFP
jgi:hypothetical protein